MSINLKTEEDIIKKINLQRSFLQSKCTEIMDVSQKVDVFANRIYKYRFAFIVVAGLLVIKKITSDNKLITSKPGKLSQFQGGKKFILKIFQLL